MIVLDASAAIELVLNTSTGQRVAQRISDEGESLHVPHLIDVEVLHVIRGYVLRDVLRAEQGDAAIELWRLFDVERYAHEPFIERIWQLRHNYSAYDATYVALAEVLAVPLLTADARLASAPGNSASIETI